MRVNTARLFFSALFAALCVSGMPVWADSTYTDVIYQQGYPGFLPGPFIGTVSIKADALSFQTRTGRQFSIPRHTIRQFGYSGTTTTRRGYGLTLAGPSPIALAASLGVTVLENTLIHRKKKSSNIVYSVRFRQPEEDDMREVLFKIPNEAVGKGLMADLQKVPDKQVIDRQAPETLPAPEPAAESGETILKQ